QDRRAAALPRGLRILSRRHPGPRSDESASSPARRVPTLRPQRRAHAQPESPVSAPSRPFAGRRNRIREISGMAGRLVCEISFLRGTVILGLKNSARSGETRESEGTLRRISLAVVALALSGCAHTPAPQSETHLKPAEAAPSGSIPAPAQISTCLPLPKPTLRPETYTVVVNGVKVQELLFALARDAKVNVDIHSGIAGVVTINAIDQTLPQLLSRIAKQVDMRWELDGPNLTVMPDSPYLHIYKIDYLNMERLPPGGGGGVPSSGSGSWRERGSCLRRSAPSPGRAARAAAPASAPRPVRTVPSPRSATH